jgi:hypothetical protein
VSITGLAATPKGGTALRVADAALTLSGSRASLAATELSTANGEKAFIDGVWDTSSDTFGIGLNSQGMSVDALKPFLANAQVPMLSQLAGGTWSGVVRNEGGRDGWRGDLRITDSSLRFEAFAEPMRISQADVVLDDKGTSVRKMAVAVAGMDVQGDYSYEPGARVPHVVHLTAGQVDAATVEKLLEPALNRAGLLNKTLNFGKVPTPEWLHNLHAGGTLQIASLTLGALTMTRVRSRLEWNAETVVFPGLSAVAGGANITGALTADLTGAEPRYEFSGRAGGINWRGGSIEAEGRVSTAGSGAELLGKLAAKGAFTARNLDLAPVNQFSSAQGEFDLTWTKGGPRLTLVPLSATAGGVSWRGSVEPRDNGEVLVKLAAGEKLVQASGAIFRGDPLVLAASPR